MNQRKKLQKELTANRISMRHLRRLAYSLEAKGDVTATQCIIVNNKIPLFFNFSPDLLSNYKPLYPYMYNHAYWMKDKKDWRITHYEYNSYDGTLINNL